MDHMSDREYSDSEIDTPGFNKALQLSESTDKNISPDTLELRAKVAEMNAAILARDEKINQLQTQLLRLEQTVNTQTTTASLATSAPK